MYKENEIKKLLDELILLELNKGVQPEELVKDIQNEGYTRIAVKKMFGSICCSIHFVDSCIFGNEKSEYEYRYIYDMDMYLRQIVLLKGKNESVVWNKERESLALMNSIINMLSKSEEGEKQITTFVESLSENLKSLVNKYNCLAEIS